MSTGNINEAYCERLDRGSLVEKISEGLSKFYDKRLLASDKDVFTSRNPEKLTDYMQVFGSEEEKVYQLLRSVAKVGDEIISVIDIVYSDNKGDLFSQSAITRYVPNNRAEFITFINRGEEPTILGRGDLNSDNMTISRVHCQFYQDESGNINCTDLNSKNHTKIFSQMANSDGETASDPRNPARDFTTWSLKPNNVKEILNLQ